MNLGLEGKRALVLGAGGSIGGAIVESLSREGCEVSLLGRTLNSLDATAARMDRPPIARHSLDLGEVGRIDEEISQICESDGPIDIVMCAAAGAHFESLWTVDTTEWLREIEVKYLATMLAFRAASRHMAAHGRCGALVALSGIASEAVFSTNPMNGATNAALENNIRILAAALAPVGIRAVCVSPGMTRSKRYSAFTEMGVDAGDASIPIGRIAEPDEIADVCVFLASERASYVTGTTVVADGGRRLWDGGSLLPGNEHLLDASHKDRS